MVSLKIKRLHKDAIIPKYQTNGSSGFDLHSVEDISIPYKVVEMVHTGLSIQLPRYTELQVRQRSGISILYPKYIVIGVGTVDEDYRGELMVPIINNNNNNKIMYIKKGDRIAQGIVMPIIRCEINEVDTLTCTKRGTGGFGHTG